MELSEKAYEQLWNAYCELGKREQHFNNIQTRYRALASTWALAALAGIGFAIKEKPDIMPTQLLVSFLLSVQYKLAPGNYSPSCPHCPILLLIPHLLVQNAVHL